MREFRKAVEAIIQLLIDALDQLDSAIVGDLEEAEDREPDDTGVADRDALATMERAQRSWYDDDDSG